MKNYVKIYNITMLPWSVEYKVVCPVMTFKGHINTNEPVTIV